MTDVVKVDVRRSGRRFEAEAVLDLAADPHTVWETITDYPALPRFMPGIHACRVIGRQPAEGGAEKLVVEQHGEFRFMLFAQSMKVMLDIEHEPLRRSEAKATSFDLGLLKKRAIDVFEGRYEIHHPAGRRSAGAPRVQLRYSAVIGLRLPPPPAVGAIAVQQNLATQLQAVAAEVGRRHAARRRLAS
jgi:hypothetical protein